jgi:hypothetical protein
MAILAMPLHGQDASAMFFRSRVIPPRKVRSSSSIMANGRRLA